MSDIEEMLRRIDDRTTLLWYDRLMERTGMYEASALDKAAVIIGANIFARFMLKFGADKHPLRAFFLSLLAMFGLFIVVGLVFAVTCFALAALIFHPIP
ncbi:hypothetical protein [Candidatus Methanodesulfokora washburnensis]|uniref:Uncharacterized protein n=1 Tax=Candidatus Methanodesulfokora washburnensis TaxID=2478471 RepID=A0A3R9RKE6_9CREN|nr:hypothetical protein [Candidatus Methanodesulfokores washburnensis]RSN72234.1 hypothetical protein D6D85_14645 [Candidatus Methanodesulfokores washburnensis]